MTATGVDVAAAERAVIDLLVAIGEDPSSAELVETPARVARAFAELLAPPPAPAPVWTDDGGYDGLVVVRDLAFRSVCADHLVPFSGVVHVAYGRGPVVLGPALVAHAVDRCAHRLQSPSRLAASIAAELERDLEPWALGVAVEVTRPCPDLSADAPATARTTALRGALRTDPRVRAEFVRLTSAARPDR
jgi:GTP cyclohydrolase I